MKRLSLLFLLTLSYATLSLACTNIIVGKSASTDGSVLCSYNADSYGTFMQMSHYPAATHRPGEMRKIIDWDTNRPLGEIPEATETYNVLGNINEYQVGIGETTFGGREEMVDSTGIIDYGSLIYIALQRSRTAREAIHVMTTLAETYGYCSEGETFSICDPNEAWIMEMMGKGPGSHGVVWVALRIPDDAICAHANQSRIRTFNQKDTTNVLVSDDCIGYARRMGWFTGSDENFSFRDAYCPLDFSGRRICEARVWSIFNHTTDMSRYIDFAAGEKPLSECEEMPLWIVPDNKVSLHDVQTMMRDHFEGTPFSLDTDMGEGLWEMPYRPTPLYFEYEGQQYFNERPVSTQQSSFTFVVQLRQWLPREIGGVIWFGNDDANMVPYVPVYCANTAPPKCFSDPDANDITFSENSAYWVSNWVSNMVYPRYSMMFPVVEKKRDWMDSLYQAHQYELEQTAIVKYAQSPKDAVDYLTQTCDDYGWSFMLTWKDLAIFLIVKFNDMIAKPTNDEDQFLLTEYGLGATVIRPGYPSRTAKRLIESTGGKFLMPKE